MQHPDALSLLIWSAISAAMVAASGLAYRTYRRRVFH